MSSNERIPGLQYPSWLDESKPNDAALKVVYDNLFYLKKAVQSIPSASSILTTKQVEQIITQILNPSGGGGSGFVTIGTHVIRLTTAPTLGALFYEQDRKYLYVGSNQTGPVLWTYAAGVMYDTYANRPQGLGLSDIGALYVPSDHLHWCEWAGTSWTIIDDDGGIFVESLRALGSAGYHPCDGTNTTYLSTSGADLIEVVVTTPNENSAPSGVYHKSIAAYTGTINAATTPTISGNTGDTIATNNANTTGVTVSPHTVVQDAQDGADHWDFDNQADASHNVNDPGHNHGQNAHHHDGSTLTVSSAEPRNIGVLRYVRK